MKGTFIPAAAALLVATASASAMPDEGMALGFVARSDLSGDGNVTIAEYRAANPGTSEKWFRRLDASGDGVVTGEEVTEWDSRKSLGLGS